MAPYLRPEAVPPKRVPETQTGEPRLLGLPSEVILHVSSYLEPEPETPAGPFSEWTRVLQDQVDKALADIQAIHALSLTCKEFYRLFTPILQSYIPISGLDSDPDDDDILTVLLRSFEMSNSLMENITSAAVPAWPSDELHYLFGLPNIHTLSIRKFNQLWESDDHAGTSPVRTLRMTCCGAYETPLKQLLSWPSALRELWYELELSGWNFGHHRGEDGIFSTSAFERCLASQATTLEKLVLSQVPPLYEGIFHERIFYGGGIDLRTYEKLRSLSISQVLLINDREDRDVWMRLPKSLVELEVFYYENTATTFIWGGAVRPDWLFDLLENKDRFLPALERVRILSFERWDGEPERAEGEEDSDEEDSDEEEVGPRWNEGDETVEGGWNPSVELTRAFVNADVSFSLFIHQDHRFKYVADGKGWEDNWEDTFKVVRKKKTT